MKVEEVARATVTDNQDPEQRGRIKVTSAQAIGASDGPLPMWIEPIQLWGWFVVPDIGEEVEIVFAAHGDMDESRGQSSLEAPDVRWRGQRFWTEAEAPEPRPVPVDFTSTNYGKRRGFATPQGHVMMFDDTEGKEKVSIMWHGVRDGADAYSLFALDEDGSLVMSNKNGSLIYLNAADEQLTIIDQHGNSYTSDADGIRLVDAFSNIISMGDGVVQIISQDAIVATGADFTAATGTVNLVDGASQPIVRGTELVTWLSAHTHADAMGGTGPPVVPPPASVLSTFALVE